jgi:hypothetical protein
MQRFPLFTDGESERLRDAAVAVIAKRCAEDAGYLRTFIREYLGGVETAFPPVYERCQQDRAYLSGIVREEVLTLCEEDILDLLRRSPDSARLSERLGFDPLEPRSAQAYQTATRSLNRPQRAVLVGALCISVLMALFPPWVEECWKTKVSQGKVVRVALLGSRSAGHGLWGSYQPRIDVQPQGSDDSNPLGELLLFGLFGPKLPHSKFTYGQETVYRVDVGSWVIQFTVVWGVASFLLVVFAFVKRSYSEHLRRSGASRLEGQPMGNAEPNTAVDRPHEDRIRAAPVQDPQYSTERGNC